MDDRGNCHENVSSVVNDSRYITGAHTQCRFTGGVSRAHHAGSACCQGQICFPHHLAGQFDRGLINPADDIFGGTCGNSGFQNYLSCLNGALLCSGMRGYDNTVTSFQADQRFEDSSCGGVGGRDNRCYNTDRLSNLLNAVGRIFLQYTAGLFVLICVVDILRSVVILDYLVFHNTHSGLFNRHLCQLDTSLVGSGGCCQKNGVNLFLGIGGESVLCFTGTGKGCGQLFGSSYGSIGFCHRNHPFQ